MNARATESSLKKIDFVDDSLQEQAVYVFYPHVTARFHGKFTQLSDASISFPTELDLNFFSNFFHDFL